MGSKVGSVGCPETSETTNQRRETSQKTEDLIVFATEGTHRAEFYLHR